MSRTFTTVVELQSGIESVCKTAVSEVAKIVCEKLQDLIYDDYYRQYIPKYYERTWQLFDAPEMNMLSSALAEVFLNTGKMNYENMTGKFIAELSSQGFHGSKKIETEGHYWDDFLEWCEKNIPSLLKTSLREQGLFID